MHEVQKNALARLLSVLIGLKADGGKVEILRLS